MTLFLNAREFFGFIFIEESKGTAGIFSLTTTSSQPQTGSGNLLTFFISLGKLRERLLQEIFFKLL